MTVSAEVQTMLDKARENRSLVGSVDHGVAALRVQIGQLNDRLSALPVGKPGITDEDKAALLEAASELDASAETLKNDIPANVADAAPGDGTAQPLAGTGAPTEAQGGDTPPV